MPVLIEYRGDHEREHRLGARCTLGRAPDCTIELADALVSRTHAEIRQAEDGTFEIFDRGSTHGTFVCGERLGSPRVLEEGDEIIVGSTRLLFRHIGDTQAGRRWSGRVPCDLAATAILPAGDKITGTVRDLSLTGVRLELAGRGFDLDTEFTLTIAFAGRWRPLKMGARVANVNADRRSMGIALLFPSERRRLTYVEEYAALLQRQRAKK